MSIKGSFIDLGSSLIGDVDAYKIKITDTATFSATMTADLPVWDDAMMWLFDESGKLVFENDDTDFANNLFLPSIFAGDLIGLGLQDNAFYYLAVGLYDILPANYFTVDINLQDGWSRATNIDLAFFDVGPYELNLTGAEVSTVPAPSILVLSFIGLVAVVRSRRE